MSPIGTHRRRTLIHDVNIVRWIWLASVKSSSGGSGLRGSHVYLNLNRLRVGSDLSGLFSQRDTDCNATVITHLAFSELPHPRSSGKHRRYV